MKGRLLVIACLLLAFTANGQKVKYWLKFGNEAYDEGDYYGASLYYKSAMEVDSFNLEVLHRYAECLRMYNEYEKAEYYYEKLLKKDRGKTYPETQYWLAQMQKYNGNYKASLKSWKAVSRKYKRDKKSYYYRKAEKEKESCKYAMQMSKVMTSTQVSNLGKGVNTTSSEFSAFLFDSTLYYSAMRAENMNDRKEVLDKYYRIRIYKADAADTSWSGMETLDTTINSVMAHAANGSFSPDKQRFYFTRCNNEFKCSIYVSEYNNGSWGTPKKLGSEINGKGENNTQPMAAMVGDKELLFFTSDRPGGRGQLDIWYSEVTNGNKYGRALNAGHKVNTPDNDITPFYHSDGNALYFSSTWHNGLGGFDVFMAKGKPGNFSEPENMKQPVNTSTNDFYFTIYPGQNKGFLTSNRKGSYTTKGETCCNDIYVLQFPEEETPVDSIIYLSLKDLNEHLPVTLYFHNDEPNPRTTKSTTNLNYITTYNAYTALQETYKKEYASGLSGEKATKAQADISGFFKDYVDKGVKDLKLFTELLLKELDKGYNIEVTVKGFASPLAKTDYNVKLTGRRISSMINYLKEYQGGVYNKYLVEKDDKGNVTKEATAENGGSLSFVKIPFGEYTADKFISDNPNEQKESIYAKGAALERKIEIISVNQARKDSAYAEMTFITEIHDFGKLTQGDTISHVFTLKNTGNQNLEIKEVKPACNCIKVDLPITILKPGELVQIEATFNSSGLEGKTVKTFDLITNGVPETKTLTLTSEIFPDSN